MAYAKGKHQQAIVQVLPLRRTLLRRGPNWQFLDHFHLESGSHLSKKKLRNPLLYTVQQNDHVQVTSNMILPTSLRDG